MSKIWGSILIFCIGTAIISGASEVVIESIMKSSESAIENILVLAGMMCFWSGIFKIFENTSVINKLSKFFSYVVNLLFDKRKLSEKTKEYISLNMVSNIVGIGNAATLNGIKAIESMQEENDIKSIPSDNMTTFVLVNTASIQLIPTSIIALRSMYGSQDPSGIIIPVWIVTFFSFIFGIIAIKILNKKM